MKKIVSILLVLAAPLSASLTLTGCGKESDDGDPNATGSVLPINTILPALLF